MAVGALGRPPSGSADTNTIFGTAREELAAPSSLGGRMGTHTPIGAHRHQMGEYGQACTKVEACTKVKGSSFTPTPAPLSRQIRR